MTKNYFLEHEEPLYFRSIFISDVHLGTKFSQAHELLEFFKFTRCENLYLVGDIIDVWAIKSKMKWAQSHTDVIQKILRK
ncbi:MAG: UDP-2,3-diacylglucosamine diphosphatase, partial [Sulfurospirillaceae bacterium]|nr:UDP-2,3-diacylglucosamine diphosphatase [Sulfurospirillaceae bacterium]